MTEIFKVEIVLPVCYENLTLVKDSTIKLLDHLKKIQGPYLFKVTISINGSNAETLINIVSKIREENIIVNYSVTEKQGKGHGVISAWQNSSADILVYMDIDLATSLNSFEQLLLGIKNGGDLCIGSRYLHESNLNRTIKRYVLSRLYHTILIRAFLGLRVNDVQCGYKAIDRNVFLKIRPHLTSYNFFFDAELVYVCHIMNKIIIELPVTWTESEVSSVKLFRTSVSFLISAILLKVRRYGNKAL